MIIQRKVLSQQGRNLYKEWELDVPAIRSLIEWARENPDRLQKEVDEMASEQLGFPEFITTIGKLRSLVFGGYGVPITCEKCDNLLIFQNNLRCISCNTEYNLKDSAVLLAYAGKIPCKIGVLNTEKVQIEGGPFLSSVMERMSRMREKEKVLFQNYFFTMDNGTAYFSPPIYAYFPRNWPRSEPYVIVYKTYFDVLGIPVQHVYNLMDVWYRLCLYATWRENITIKEVLKNRVVPRIYIDLMIADLVAVRKLDDFIRALGMSLHEAYNLVGRRGSEKFEQVYYSMIGEH